MALPVTESLHPEAKGLDALPAAAALGKLLDGQQAALASVRAAIPDITRGAALMAQALRSGGRLIYGGAGSSALMAMADALELPGTYGIPSVRISILMAGGMPGAAEMPGHTEDDAQGAQRDAAMIGADDALIVVSASGSTPYALALAEAARAKGAKVIGIANNPGTPILTNADAAICLATPPELIAGSTRMGAGTAQKAALNMMSTLMAIELGSVHDGMMVDLVADNAKLKVRATRIVAAVAEVSETNALKALDHAGGAVKAAALIARGLSPADAARRLSETQGNLRAALARLTDPA